MILSRSVVLRIRHVLEESCRENQNTHFMVKKCFFENIAFFFFRLTLILLTYRIWWAPNNASRWQMRFNSAFKGLKCPLTLILLMWRIWWAPNNASRWQMGFNSAFKGLIWTNTVESGRLQAHTQNIFPFNGNNGYANAPLCYVIVYCLSCILSAWFVLSIRGHK